jgi:hypothetical protein
MCGQVERQDEAERARPAVRNSVSTSRCYSTARYFFISHSVSWTRYSSHSFRFSST